MALTDRDRLILPVQAGDRCTLRKKYVCFGDGLGGKEVPLGRAHILSAPSIRRSHLAALIPCLLSSATRSTISCWRF